MASESKSAVIGAMGANLAIAIAKLIGGLITGSAALLAEAGHSLADTVNQVFLLTGINLSGHQPDEAHPHGYGKEPFFWSFLAAIFIFVAGATFSVYEGTRTLVEGHEHDRTGKELALAFGILGVATVIELGSMTLAVRAIAAGARGKSWSFLRYVREAPDPTAKTVFYEDGAAVTGLLIAAGGLALAQLTGNEAWDGIASLGIGVVLAGVAFILGAQARSLLLGAAAHKDTRNEIHETLNSFPEVEQVVRVLTMQLGAHSILVTGELQVERAMTADAIEGLMDRIDALLKERLPEVVDTFWELKRIPGEGNG